MRLGHTRSYKLYRKTKTKALSVMAAFVFAASIASSSAISFFTLPKVNATPGSVAIYNALPDVSTPINYPSQAFQATSTSEFGDYVHLGGSNRKLDTVTVTMSNWAKYADYSSNPTYSGNTATWTLPVTLNVYSDQFNSNGTPTNKIATVTQTVAVPWRPASDPTCGNTSNGTGWKVGDTCYNFSGIAFNAGFDLSSLNVSLPEDIVVSVAYNTQTHGYAPTGLPGPYNSLNVAIPPSQSVSVGTDKNTDQVLINSTWSDAYGDGGSTGMFRQTNDWTPYGTVALRVTATAPPSVTPCATTSTVHTTDLSTWYLGETRATGHNELNADGLHVWTEGNTSTDKAAGYYTTSFDLANLGEGFGLDATAAAGTIPPALQLTVDLDGNGTPEGNLVAEPGFYGANTLWLSSNWTGIDLSGAPATVNGGGTGKGGTVNAWLAAFPNAKVVAIGYSLGSGVHGDYVITKITAGCTNYTFGLPAAPAVPTNLRFENPAVACGGYTNINWTSATWDSVPGAVSYDYHVDGPGGLTYDTNLSGTSNSGTFGSGVPGTYTFKVRSVNGVGLKSDWSSSCSITYDPVVPTLPAHLSPANNSSINYNDFYFDWTDSSDTSPITYEFQSSQNPAVDSNGALSNGVWNNIAHGAPDRNNLTSSTIHSYGANGTWYWQVRAIDAAGNKSAWTSAWKITIDMVAPAVPTNLGWKTSTNAVVANGGETNIYDGTASWEGSGDTSYYVYKYWNDIPGNQYKIGSEYPANVGGTSLFGVFNQGEGIHHFCVVAVDSAGNQSACSAPFTITYDPTAPVVTISGVVQNSNGTHTINGTTDDPAAPVIVRLNGSELSGVTMSGNNWNVTIPSPAAGTHTVTADSSDSAGNPASQATTSFAVALAIEPQAEEEEVDNGTQNGGGAVAGVATTNTGGPGLLQNIATANTGASEDEDDTATTQAADTSDSDQEGVLGASTDNNSSTSTAAVTTGDSSKFLGLGWWWLVIGLGLLGLWWLIAAIRRRQEDETA